MRFIVVLGGSAAVMLVAFGTAACSAPAAHGDSRTAGVAQPADVAGARLTSLALASPERGLGLFDSGTGSRCQALSGVTVDGGARFGSPAVITSWTCAAAPPVTSIAADGAGHAFAFGPDLFVTGNAAGPWRSSPQPGSVLAVSAVGRSVWLLLAVCGPAGGSGGRCALRLAESADGGRSWQPAAAQPAGAFVRGTGGGAGPVLEPALGQTWLLRTGPSAGYLVSYPSAGASGRAGSAPLWYTGDGGRTWSRWHIPCAGMSVVLAAVPGGGLAAVCAGEPAAGSQGKSTTVSADSGRSWTKPAGCALLQPCRDSAVLSGYVGQIAAISAQVIYLAGGRSALLVTADSGRHWHEVRPLIGDSGGGTSQVIFFGSSRGVVLGDSPAAGEAVTIWHTSNSGRTWSAVRPTLG